MKNHIANFSNSVIHCSRSPEYRSPFGAQKTGSYVDLAIDVYCKVDEVVLCYAYGLYSLSYSELRCTKKEADGVRWYARLRMPSEPGLLFYWFCLRSKNEDIEKIVEQEYIDFLYRKPEEEKTYLYYVASWEEPEGKGKFAFTAPRVGVHEDKYPHAFQITVYDKDFKTPDWMKGAVMYQIFPDRFARDKGFSFSEMEKTGVERLERIFHEDWYEDVDIHGKEETGYLACDFYGGSLPGIAEKADYLKSLNIDVLYLNPICEARSNHRYDTADYMNVDPILGGKEGYKLFSKIMHEQGIRYILDGVFSHTGADSRYFNKFGRYPGNGAYSAFTEGKESPFASWYSFWRHEDGQVDYDAWWGFPDLPNVREDDLTYRDYILGPNGVVARWLRGGASGIRLDVSDELPDSFLREMRSCVKEATAGDGIVLGEVWEEATTKISYGNYRDFAFGRTHDTVMGYPFREPLLHFLRGDIDAQAWSLTMERMRENFPDEMFYCMMNLISSHDVPRAITVLAGKPDPGDRESQKKTPLTEEEKRRGLALLRLAFFVQMTYPGCPCIYYGDEIGMEGYRDPFNRRTYPWGKETSEQIRHLDEYRKLSVLRRENEVLRNGEIKMLYAKDDALVYLRYLQNNGKDHFGKDCQGSNNALCILNRSDRMILLVDYDPVSGVIAVEEKEESSSNADEICGPICENGYSGQQKKIQILPMSYKITLWE
ncbi:MAG: glycoside hydrolase family 13 protein [Clostridiales bacterium]|nr:glycoside hydrolase family 13 protein [Clostridiales bacterium]